jgi:hypothetical protein
MIFMKGVFSTLHYTSKTDGSAESVRQMMTQNLKTARIITLNQVHKDNIIIAGDVNPDKIPEADGVISLNPEDTLVIRTADCLPVLAFSDNGISGAFHAGWRGLSMGIVKKGILKMKSLGANSIRIAAGPAIGPCCFRVNADVAKEFRFPYLRTDNEGGYYFDLWEMAKAQAMAASIPNHMITSYRLCTCCSKQLFNSYRRDGLFAGRQISAIGGRSWSLPGLQAV